MTPISRRPLLITALFCRHRRCRWPTQAEWPSIQPSKGLPSGIARKFLNGLRNPGARHHRTVASPPLPRPRAAELPGQSVELNKAAPVAPTLDPPTGVEPGKVLGGRPPKSNQTPDANKTPAESAAIDLAKASAEAAAPVEPDEAPPAEIKRDRNFLLQYPIKRRKQRRLFP